MLRFPFGFCVGGRPLRTCLGVVEYPVEVLEKLGSLAEEIFFNSRNSASALC